MSFVIRTGGRLVLLQVQKFPVRLANRCITGSNVGTADAVLHQSDVSVSQHCIILSWRAGSMQQPSLCASLNLPLSGNSIQ